MNSDGNELANALRYGPFHHALRTAIAYRALSLSRLRAHLERIDVPVAESTLSYWQRGLRHPDTPRALATVRGLEEVLGLPGDSLVTLVSPCTRGPNSTAPYPPDASAKSEPRRTSNQSSPPTSS